MVGHRSGRRSEPARNRGAHHGRRRRGGHPRDANASHLSEAARTMTKRTHGTTTSGKAIDDDLIEDLVDEAEAGYDVDDMIARRGQRGRPRLGSAPSTVESVRL